MMNYKEYSYNAFIALKDEKKVDGYSLYNPNENIAIYADRFGVAMVWHFNVETKTITIREMNFVQPTLLTEKDYLWLRNIAKSKHWRGGVKKIDHYRHIGKDFLDVDGIDPYFYAWMAEHNYSKRIKMEFTDVCDNIILSEEEFNNVCVLSATLNENFESLLKKVHDKKNGDVTFNFNKFLIQHLNEQHANNKNVSLYDKVTAFVNSVLPSNVHETVRDCTIYSIHETLKNVIEHNQE